MDRKPYPSDVSGEAWASVAPYLTLTPEVAPHRNHPLREVFNGLWYIVHTGSQWRMMPNDLPSWHTVYQQTQRRPKASVHQALVGDLRMFVKEIEGRNQQAADLLRSITVDAESAPALRDNYAHHITAVVE